MIRWAVLSLAFLLLLVLPIASADYLQEGVNAARTGVTPDAGPVRDDVAFSLSLPGAMPDSAHPIIADGSVYLAVEAVETTDLTTNGVVRVDLSTADVEVVLETDTSPLALVSDGALLYLVRELGVDAYPMGGGAPAWTWERDSFTNLVHAETRCQAPAVNRGTLYLLCTDLGTGASLVPNWGDTPEGVFHPIIPPAAHAESVVFTAALDTASGEARWIRVEEAVQSDESAPPGPSVHEPRATPGDGVDLGGISIAGDLVFTTSQQPGKGGVGEARVQAMRAEDGSRVWQQTTSLPQQAAESGQNQNTAFVEGTRANRLLSPATGSTDEIYYIVRDLVAADPATGSARWSHPLPQVQTDGVGGNAFVLSGNDLYVASLGVLFKFDRAGEGILWDRALSAGEHFDAEPVVLAGGILYGRTHDHFESGTQDPRQRPEGNANNFYAYNPGDGQVLWKHPIHQDKDRYVVTPGNQFTSGVAEGVMAIQGVDGTLRVLGTTPASLAPVIDVSDAYPDVREDVSVDLSGTGSGVHGPATEYRASWDDGTVTEWQRDPVMTHAYASQGEHVAELSVRNDAGQTATTTATFHVGETVPNFLSTAFAPANQDMTFGVVGVALALAGGAIGLAHRRRRRGRLARELDAIEAVHDSSHHEPDVCTKLLLERKTHARALAVEGKLDQTQLQIIETRISELTRALRITEANEAFDFLPSAFATSLRTVLNDGQVTRYERESLLRALDEETEITDAQKALVRERLRAWFKEEASKR